MNLLQIIELPDWFCKLLKFFPEKCKKLNYKLMNGLFIVDWYGDNYKTYNQVPSWAERIVPKNYGKQSLIEETENKKYLDQIFVQSSTRKLKDAEKMW